MDHFLSTLLSTWIFVLLCLVSIGLGYFITGKVKNRQSCGGINKVLCQDKKKSSSKEDKTCSICGK